MMGSKEKEYNGILKVSSVIDKLKIGIGERKFPGRNAVLGYTWEQLKKLGVICETIQTDDDGFVTILKEFISHDKTLTRTSKYIIEKDRYEELVGKVSINEVYKEIEELESEIECYSDSQNYEICDILKQELDFLKQNYNIQTTTACQ